MDNTNNSSNNINQDNNVIVNRTGNKTDNQSENRNNSKDYNKDSSNNKSKNNKYNKNKFRDNPKEVVNDASLNNSKESSQEKSNLKNYNENLESNKGAERTKKDSQSNTQTHNNNNNKNNKPNNNFTKREKTILSNDENDELDKKNISKQNISKENKPENKQNHKPDFKSNNKSVRKSEDNLDNKTDDNSDNNSDNNPDFKSKDKEFKPNKQKSRFSNYDYDTKPINDPILQKKMDQKIDAISLSENKTYFIDRTQLSDKTQRVLKGPRFIAVKILNRFDRSDSYVDILLNNELNKNELSSLDKGLLTEIVNGVIRWRARLDWVLNGFYHGEFQKCLNLVKNAMRIALYQMLFLNKIPHPAAIDDSVEIVKHIQGDKAAGLVNGVLRNIARNIANIRYPSQNDDYPHYLSVIYSHPKWMTKRWLDRFGSDDAIKLLEANNLIPNIPIRINRNNYSLDKLIELFDEKSIKYTKMEKFDNLLWLEQNINVAHSELFKSGNITIQDPSASLIPLLCNPKENSFVVDMCSAPGGKTVYLAELMHNKGKILALDKFPNRLKQVEETALRMGYTNIETKEADSTSFELDKNNLADLVLVDAPCTGLGTITKKPEIKWKRELEDMYDINKVQISILENAAKLVKIGGALVYSTCTIEPDENMMIIEKFLIKNPNFEIEDAGKYVNEFFVKDKYIQTFPHIHKIDGAFGARLIRKK